VTAIVQNEGTANIATNYQITTARNNTLGNTQNTVTLSAKALTISGITASNKEYDGNDIAAIDTNTAIKTGLVVGDAVTVSATGLFDNKNVGTGKAITISSTYGGVDAGNYTITDQPPP
jgi:hypothetical protein